MIGRRLPASSSFVLAAARLRALQLDTACTTAQTGSDQEATSHTPSPATATRVTGPGQHALLTKGIPMGAAMRKYPPFGGAIRRELGMAGAAHDGGVMWRGRLGPVCNGPVDGWYHAAPYWLSHIAQEGWRPSACSS
jgi:hypothetical protein